ncbi:uncharacterized protein VTP21DRAFT_5044 [Calcarisporiella thermophila]|uniref:uncharacterized protein n=1 Tax=Calcarisporiella thermophila TaxID=911321 RepID=UPI003742D48F
MYRLGVPLAPARNFTSSYSFRSLNLLLAKSRVFYSTSKGNDTTPLESDPSKLPATVGFHRHHLFVLSGQNPEAWPGRLELVDSYLMELGSVMKSLSVKVNRAFVMPSTNEAGQAEPEDEEARDLLLFPNMLRLPQISSRHFPALADYIRNPTAPTTLLKKAEKISGTHVFVCVHGTRDCRCGVYGTMLAENLIEIARQKGRPDVKVWGVSHIGGHKYAGNAIVYPQGDWYGLIHTREDATALLEHLDCNTVMWERWRGRLGLTSEEQEQIAKDRHHQLHSSAQATKEEEVRVIFEFPNGEERIVSGRLGERVLDVAQRNDIPLEGVCGGNQECATCHVIVKPEQMQLLPPVSENEEDMLEYAPFREDTSRLGCQIKLHSGLDNLHLRIPVV